MNRKGGVEIVMLATAVIMFVGLPLLGKGIPSNHSAKGRVELAVKKCVQQGYTTDYCTAKVGHMDKFQMAQLNKNN